MRQRLLVVFAATVVIVLSVGCGDNSNDGDELSSGEAEGAVKAYYKALDDFEYSTAWDYLGRQQKDALGMGFGGWSRSWKRNYRMKVKAGTVTPLDATTATVAVTLSRLDYDACNNKVWQTYSGTWTVRLNRGLPLLDSESLNKVAGPEPVLAISDCATILPPPPTQTVSDSGPERLDGSSSHEFEPEDIERANEASDAVKEYCSGAVSEAQEVGCLSHVDESDIP
jgi:hypothetical protein